MKLLEKQAAQNEGLMEENEKFSKDQASLLRILGQRDEELKKTHFMFVQSKNMGTKVLLNTIRKFTYEKSIRRVFEQWKSIRFTKTDKQ